MRIRSFGFLVNRQRTASLALCRQLLAVAEVPVPKAETTGTAWRCPHCGGPRWSRNGHELFFETLDNHIMAAAYMVKGDSFLADKPRLWSEKSIGAVGRKNYDLAPDGKRIVAGAEAQNHVVFLENFADELQRKVPVGK